ncbi:hypothetical protein PM3016_452 [Paenibacillus mucilaginosus 3016]|uniref:SLH domain-containing protein n=1 Tax=Paenibacillus mucilaginosus 3016 TaxID=1116391 RepID=H6NSK1_9BACL|nr:hypothetical protein PM3016_452 [Paenibacillus mucilaginosus 3016]WFA16328.1 S-layer homology domain-containing protein [Paenibacillus mucilaginosus]
MTNSTKSTQVDMAARMYRNFRQSTAMVSKTVVTCMLGTTLLTAALGAADSAYAALPAEGAALPLSGAVYGSGGQGAASPLTDLDGSYAKKEILALAEAGVVSGYEDGTFAPTQGMTRAEMAKIIAKAMGLAEDPSYAEKFTDIAADSWYKGYVGALLKAGITQGTSETAFSPDSSVTREELVVFFVRAFGLEKAAEAYDGPSVFTDQASISPWALPHVHLAYGMGFIGGVASSDGTLRFDPRVQAERQALARLAYEYIGKKQDYVAKAKELVAAGQQPGKDAPKAEDPAPVSTASAGGSAAAGGGGGGGGSSSSKKTERALEQALASLAIGFASGDSEQNVRNPIALPATVVYKENGSKDKTVPVSWTSSNQDIVGADGMVNRPAAGQPDVQVVLTASVQKGSSKASRNYELTVKALTSPVPDPDPQPDPDPKPDPQPTGLIRSISGVHTEETRAAEGLQLVEFQVELSKQVEEASEIPHTIMLGDDTFQVLVWQEGEQRQQIPISFLDVYNREGTSVIVRLHEENNVGPAVQYGQKYTVELRAGNGEVAGSKFFQIGLQPTEVKVEDHDETPGVDGRDFSVTWSPSAWEEAELQQVYILPVETELDRSKHRAVAEFRDRTSHSWTGSVNTADSAGQALALKEYAIVVVSSTADAESSEAVTFVPDGIITAQPAVETKVYNNGGELLGRGEPNTFVYLKDNRGRLVGDAKADGSGRFKILLPTFFMGEEGAVLTVSAKSAGKLESTGVSVPVVAGTKSVISGLQAQIYEDGGAIHIPREFRGSVRVSAGDGTVLAEEFIYDYEYSPFTIMLNQPWQTAKLNAGERIAVRVQEYRKSPSDPVYFEVKPLEGVTNKPVVTGTVYNALSRIELEVEDYSAAISLRRSNGSLLWHGFRGGYDSLSINGLLLIPGEHISLTADEFGKAESEPVILEVMTGERTKLDSVTGIVYEDGGTFTGSFSSDSEVTYRVKKWDGTFVTAVTNVSGPDTSSANFKGTYTVGEQVFVTARSKGQQASKELALIVQKGSDTKTAVPVVDNVYGTAYEVSGMAEPNAYVKVTRPDGTIFEGFASIHGYFYIPLNDALAVAGETLKVTADAPGKLESDIQEITVLNALQTPVPTVTVSVYNGVVSKLHVVSKPNAFVWVIDENGSQVAGNMADGNGISDIVLGEYPSGNKLYVKALYYGWEESAPYVVDRGVTTPSSKPSVTGVVYTDGYLLEGTAGPNSWTQLFSGGTSIGETISDQEGRFELGHNGNDWLYAGEVVQVTSQEPYRSVSPPVEFVVQPEQGKTEAPTVIGDVYENTNWLSVQTVRGALVILRDNEGKVISQNYADFEGRADLRFYPWIRQGNTFKLTSDAIGRTVSDAVVVNVIPPPPTTKPYAVTSAVYVDGGEVRGYTEAYAAVELKRTDGSVIARGSASYDGSFFLRTQPLQLANGEILALIAKAWDKSVSEAYSVTVQGIVYGQTAQPSVSGAVYETVGNLRIEAGPRQWVRAYSESEGQLFWEWTGDYPYWYRYINLTNQKVGTKVYVYADAFGQTESEPVVYTVQPSPQTAKPSVIGSVYATSNSITVSLSDYPGDSTYIRIKRADGQLVASNWAYSSTAQLSPWHTLIEGEILYVTAQDTFKKESDPFLVTVQAAPMTVTPSVYGSVYEDGGVITGTAAKYASVRVFTGDNSYITTGYADYWGSYRIDLTSYTFNPGAVLWVEAQASGYKPSYRVYLNVLPVAGQTAAPTVNGTVYQSDSYALSGYAAPYSKITVTREDGASFTAWSGEYGNFWAYYPSSYNWLHGASELKITADTYGKLVSEPLIVPVVSKKTPAPGVAVSVYGSTYTLSGYMHQLTILRISDGYGLDLTSVEVGSFTWDIPAYMIQGNRLMLTGQWNNYSVSDVVYLTLPYNSSAVGGNVYGGGSSVSGSVYGFSTGGSTASSTSSPAPADAAYQAFAAAAAVLPQRRAA